jgi:hypothetical protein
MDWIARLFSSVHLRICWTCYLDWQVSSPKPSLEKTKNWAGETNRLRVKIGESIKGTPNRPGRKHNQQQWPHDLQMRQKAATLINKSANKRLSSGLKYGKIGITIYYIWNSDQGNPKSFSLKFIEGFFIRCWFNIRFWNFIHVFGKK